MLVKDNDAFLEIIKTFFLYIFIVTENAHNFFFFEGKMHIIIHIKVYYMCVLRGLNPRVFPQT